MPPELPHDWIAPDWPAPVRVRACTTTRNGGVSGGGYASLNLAAHVGDDPQAVQANRAQLRQLLGLPAEPHWLDQVHGTAVHVAGHAAPARPPRADASVTHDAGVVCAVLTADCLPVLLCERRGRGVAAVHAGWRGLAGGVIEAAVGALGFAPGELLAWLGPAIGPQAFEVGAELRAAFVGADPHAAAAFVTGAPGKWYADLYALARLRLGALGLCEVYGGGACTYRDVRRFYSYRRAAQTGRMASLVWLDPAR